MSVDTNPKEYNDEKEVNVVERDRIMDMERFIKYPSRIGWLDSVMDVYSTVYGYLVTGEMILKYYWHEALDFLYTNVIMFVNSDGYVIIGTVVSEGS